jgi:glucose/arabinose dehydrogenase
VNSAFRSRSPFAVGSIARWVLGASFVLIVFVGASPVARAATSYSTAPALGGVAFDQPVEVAFAPGDMRRAFVAERKGTIAVIRDLSNPQRDVLLDLRSRMGAIGDDHGLLSITFHPQFATNGWFYVWYSRQEGSQRAMRLARFTATGAARDQVDLASEYPLITQATGRGGHDGGQLVFGPDGYLYLSLGDGDEDDPEAAASQQRIDRSFFGGIIRIDVDRRPGSLAPNPHPGVHTDAYRVPADNPFVGASAFNGAAVDPTRVRTEFWAVVCAIRFGSISTPPRGSSGPRMSGSICATSST